MTEKIYGVTMTPNRSSPRRYVRLVSYTRQSIIDYDENDRPFKVDMVVPYLYEKVDGAASTAKVLPYSKIRGSAADPELAEQWLAHVRYQRALARE